MLGEEESEGRETCDAYSGSRRISISWLCRAETTVLKGMCGGRGVMCRRVAVVVRAVAGVR